MFQKSIDLRDIKSVSWQSNQVRCFHRKLEDSLVPLDLQIVDLENQPYQPGMAATALNAANFDADDELFVDQMMEPVVMAADGVRRISTMMLRK